MIVIKITMNVIPSKQLEMMQTLTFHDQADGKGGRVHKLWRFLRYQRQKPFLPAGGVENP